MMGEGKDLDVHFPRGMVALYVVVADTQTSVQRRTLALPDAAT